MREKLWETVIFLNLYPGTMYVLIIGLLMTALYFCYGAYMVSQMQLTHSSVLFQDVLRKLVIGAYQEKSLALLGLVLVSSFKKFTKDKKKFDRFG